MTTTTIRPARAEQDALPPLVAATPPGSGAWDPTDEQRHVLVLRAQGLSVRGCAMRSGLSRRRALAHLSACAEMAGVTAHRALVHEALRAKVLVLQTRPGTLGSAPPEGVDLAVLRGLVLDVPSDELPSAIMRSARCSYRRVCDSLDVLRGGGAEDCRLVVLGWQWGVLDATAPVLPGQGLGPSPSVPSATAPVRGKEEAWPLTSRQRVALQCVVGGMTDQESAERIERNLGTFRGHLANVRARAGVDTDRALIHRALQTEQEPLPGPQDCPSWYLEVSAEVRAVWREMVLDVPDSGLRSQIAAKLNLPRRDVDRALTELRQTGLSDRQLIRAGWACGVLDARATVTPSFRTATIRSKPVVSKPRPVVPHAFLPDGMTWHGRCPPKSADRRLEGSVRGSQFDLLIVEPAICRTLLQRVGARNWGPVLARPETGTALLIAHACSVPVGWRSARGRRATAHTVVPLPGEGTPARGGSYWAVPPTAPLWDSTRLHWLIAEPSRPSSRQIPRNHQSAPKVLTTNPGGRE
ncbi:helix-turn-helix transcriptional regulator [Streptomyces sp. NPDC056921]|uniref:helix-turn-helix transcriptional regulator n=1 Tax=Streptomyces sp. NPDC056921 TaxID=3345966 RepID=UPI0036423EA6